MQKNVQKKYKLHSYKVSTPCTPTHYKTPQNPLTNPQPTKRKICLLGGFYACFARKSLI